MEPTAVTPTPTMLKALTHPVRVRLLGLLRAEGPATATTLAARLGLNTGATSYHLRQLAQHGFVEDDAERGNGRDRWWRAAHQATRTALPAPGDRDAEDTLDAYIQSVVVVMTEQVQRAVEERPILPEEWRRASTFSDWGIRLTPSRARALLEAMVTVIQETEEDEADAAGAEDFVIQMTAFPRPGRLGDER